MKMKFQELLMKKHSYTKKNGHFEKLQIEEQKNFLYVKT